MSGALAGLIDRHAVRDAIVSVTRGLDRLDDGLVRRGFWPDARIRFGGGPAWSVDDLLGRWWEAAATLVLAQHHVFNDTLVLDGDEAWSETYHVTVLVPEGPAARLPFCGVVADGDLALQGGRLVDRFVRRGDEWRIAERHVVGDWFATLRGAAAAGAALPAAGRRATAADLDEAALLARAAVTDRVYALARAIDRLDRPLLAEVLAAGAGEPAFVVAAFATGADRRTQSHYVTNLGVDLQGDRAVVDAYYVEAHRDPGGGGAVEIGLSGGEWHVELERSPSGAWAIAAAAQSERWRGAGDGAHLDGFLAATGDKSHRDRSDGSYDPLVVDATSATAAELLDREAIRARLAGYSRSVDRLDRALMEATFDDVAPQFVDYMFRQADVRPVQNHNWTNLRIDLDGDVAHIEAYYISVHAYVDGASTGFIDGVTSSTDVHLIGGRYVRWFDRVDGRWALRNLSRSPVYPPPNGGLGDWHAVVGGTSRTAFLAATGNEHRRGQPDDPSYVGALRDPRPGGSDRGPSAVDG